MDETYSDTTLQNDITGDDNSDNTVVDEIRAKHEEQKIRREKTADILIMQITICIIILLIIASANIIRAGFAEISAQHFREMTGNEPEEFIQDAVSQAVKLIEP